MLPEEGAWIKAQLERLGARRLSPLLNVGSGSLRFREQQQPFIGALWRAFEAKGGRVVHADLRAEPGVDLVGDLGDPAFQARLRDLKPAAVLASNLLEHVTGVQGMATTLASLVPAGGHLLVTGPLVFQYHADPIDNGLRVTPQQAAAFFPGMSVVAEAVIESPQFMAEWAEAQREIRARPLGHRILRRLYWGKQFVLSRSWRRTIWSQFKDRRRTVSAFGVVLRQERQ